MCSIHSKRCSKCSVNVILIGFLLFNLLKCRLLLFKTPLNKCMDIHTKNEIIICLARRFSIVRLFLFFLLSEYHSLYLSVFPSSSYCVYSFEQKEKNIAWCNVNRNLYENRIIMEFLRSLCSAIDFHTLFVDSND